MNTKRIRIGVATLAIMLGALGSVGVGAQDAKEMQAYMEAMTPGENHSLMASLVGEWTYETQMWMAPGQPEVASSGRAVKEMILGGRYLQEVMKGEFMGFPFEGRAITGWDNAQGKLLGTWIDSSGTGIIMSSGDISEDRKSLWTEGIYFDPSAKAEIQIRMVTKLVDENRHEFEFWSTPPGGTKFLQMKVAYTREGSGAMAKEPMADGDEDH